MREVVGGAQSTNQFPLDSQAQEASERLQLALDSGAVVGTWVWDVPTDRFTADERFAKSFGLSEQLCRDGLPLELVTASIHPDDLTRVEHAITEALSKGGAYRCEYRVHQSDGVYHWIEANGRVESGEDGNPRRFPGVLLNIEARRAAEVERDRLTALLRTFTSAVPGVVYAKDLEGRMLVANHGTTELIGKPSEFYLGKTDLEFLDDKVQARIVMATDRRIMESGSKEQVEEHVNLADGTAATWLSLKAPLWDDNGEVIGLIGSSIDVTERKKAEAAVYDLNQNLEQRISIAIQEREQIEEVLRHSQKMEAVGQLTGGIAHDFNNLLAGISGSLEMIGARLAQGRVADVERYVAVAQGAVTRAASLTHRLLAFSRRQTLAPEATNVDALIHGMEELIARSIGPSIDLKIDAPPALWHALIDPAQLESALLNLCLNARDAMPDGGRIVIELANDNGDAGDSSASGEHLRIRVSDNGIGMSPATVAKAFEPFFTTKPIGAGTGLGLSMVYGFVRQSGGEISIESDEGNGTSVILHLPRYVVDVPTDTAPLQSSQEISDGRGETVLVVDDEPSVRMLVSEVVAELGYKVIEASDAFAGLEVLQSDLRIDLLISDVGLPGGMNGRQMADVARESRDRLPVLFITGYAETSVLDKCHLEPLTEVLTKPFGLDALASQIKDLISA